jgi:DNA invertase Pin-like site-specific DNA recombinase
MRTTSPASAPATPAPAPTAPQATIKGATVGYVRVSTVGQNDARQLDGVHLDTVFTDKASGKDTARPQLQAMLKHVRRGDTLRVHSMDRLSRSLSDLEAVVKGLTGRGVTVVFTSPPLTFPGDASDSVAMLMLQIMGAVAQFERSLILERQREGIAIAKAGGVYKGRKASLDAPKIAQLKALVADGVPKAQIAVKLGISRATVYSYLK